MSKLNRIYLLIVILISLTIFNCKSQNLIANGSFENYTNTLNCYGGFDNYNANPVYHVVDNWYPLNSPDYFNAICPINGYSIPTSWLGHCGAKQGMAFSGIGVYDIRNNYKEYIYQHLSSPLQAGKTYCMNFFVSRADRLTFAIKQVGAYFSTSLPFLTGGYGYVNATPQVVNQVGFITDTVGWVQIQGCFVANGGEEYITIGNFNDNTGTDTLRIPSPNLMTGTGTDVSYYYIDDVTLIDQATVGLKNITNVNAFEIYPNPNTGLLKFSDLQYCKGDYNVKILDIFGKEIINEVLKEELDISSFNKGVYTLLLYKNKQLVVTKKVMKN